MACMVDGCNFLLKAVQHEAFTYENSQLNFVDIDPHGVYPYLLVNIGSGVSMVRVDGEGKHQRVSGTNIGGGTFWGLCRLLTGKTDFDEILELSSQGDNSSVDMLVGDIYGGRDYSSIGLSANTIASSFGKVIYGENELVDYSPADVSMSLCRMISYNIGQLAYLNAKRYNLPRIFFGGFFIRGHPYTMETISFAIRFWSKGEMGAMFLRHEGFLGAVGAFMKVQALRGHEVPGSQSGKVRARFVERFAIGAPVMGGRVQGPAMSSVSDKISWVEKFLQLGRPATEAAKNEHERALAEQTAMFRSRSHTAGEISEASMAAAFPASVVSTPRIDLHLGVLHFHPSLEPFPLLADPGGYNPNTIDINSDAAEMAYWVGILQDAIPTVVQKAASSENNSAEAVRRAAAFGRAFDLHLTKLRSEPGAYGQLGLADLFELREECLREFGFADVYKLDKERENAAALEVLPDLLAELDELNPAERLLALVQGALAANIFDWGAKACVDLYHNATILEMYREARSKLSRRPWRVDDLDDFAEVWFCKSEIDDEGNGKIKSPYKRAIIFVDNAGADVVLGMLPLARELLRTGCEVVLVGNSQPAINDITAAELKSVVAKAAEVCPVLRAARDAAVAAEAASAGRVPPFPGLSQRVMSSQRLSDMVGGAGGDEDDLPVARSSMGFASGMRRGRPSLEQQHKSTVAVSSSPPASVLPEELLQHLNLVAEKEAESKAAATLSAAGSLPASPRASGGGNDFNLSRRSSLAPKGMFGESYPSPWREPRLYVIASGSGSPCLDLRRISGAVADATVGADLVIIEGMGRAIHTNLRTKMVCDVLKLAMIKNQHLARRLFNGDVYDCMCRFDEAKSHSPMGH
jgi:bifunctional damage-control phosphatase, subfamily II, fusion protein